jgi:hypothetical protein
VLAPKRAAALGGDCTLLNLRKRPFVRPEPEWFFRVGCRLSLRPDEGQL